MPDSVKVMLALLAHFQNEVEGTEAEGAGFPYLEKQIRTK
jgi:hypothetical protein